MNPRKRLVIELALVAAALVYLTAWSAGYVAAGRAAARRAAEDLAACERLAVEIGRLRDRPSVAGERQRQASETARLIEASARAAGLDPAQSLVRIVPEPPRRVGETSYVEVPTQVILRDVPLRQLVAFLHAACSAGDAGDPGTALLRAKYLRIAAPRDEAAAAAAAAADAWSAEATLAQLVYQPPAQERPRRPVRSGGR